MRSVRRGRGASSAELKSPIAQCGSGPPPVPTREADSGEPKRPETPIASMSREELERRASAWVNGARAPRLRDKAEPGKGPTNSTEHPARHSSSACVYPGTPDPLLQDVLLGEAGNSAGSVGKPDKSLIRLWNEGPPS